MENAGTRVLSPVGGEFPVVGPVLVSDEQRGTQEPKPLEEPCNYPGPARQGVVDRLTA